MWCLFVAGYRWPSLLRFGGWSTHIGGLGAAEPTRSALVYCLVVGGAIVGQVGILQLVAYGLESRVRVQWPLAKQPKFASPSLLRRMAGSRCACDTHNGWRLTATEWEA